MVIKLELQIIFLHINVGLILSNRVIKEHLLKEIRPLFHSVYIIPNPNVLKLLTRLRLGLCHLNELDLIITLKTVLTFCALAV